MDRVGRDERAELVLGRMVREMRERLHPRLERRAEILVAAPVEHDRARRVRDARELGGESRLADPGLACDECDLPFAAARPVECRVEASALRRAADERAARELGEPRRERNRR